VWMGYRPPSGLFVLVIERVRWMVDLGRIPIPSRIRIPFVVVDLFLFISPPLSLCLSLSLSLSLSLFLSSSLPPSPYQSPIHILSDPVLLLIPLLNPPVRRADPSDPENCSIPFPSLLYLTFALSSLSVVLPCCVPPLRSCWVGQVDHRPVPFYYSTRGGVPIPKHHHGPISSLPRGTGLQCAKRNSEFGRNNGKSQHEATSSRPKQNSHNGPPKRDCRFWTA